MHMHQNNNMFIVLTTLTLEECKNIIVIYKLILLINIINITILVQCLCFQPLCAGSVSSSVFTVSVTVIVVSGAIGYCVMD